MKKLAVFFPGIGYHKDKPLLYYSAKLVKNKAYEIINIEYHDLPEKIRGNQERMKLSADMAYEQAVEQLENVDFKEYSDIVFIGKSIGTVILTRYLTEHNISAGQIWYTPVEATLSIYDPEGTSGDSGVIMFIGDADPWSDVDRVKKMADEKGVSWFSYPECNHSLECNDVDRNIQIIREVMQKTENYIK